MLGRGYRSEFHAGCSKYTGSVRCFPGVERLIRGPRLGGEFAE